MILTSEKSCFEGSTHTALTSLRLSKSVPSYRSCKGETWSFRHRAVLVRHAFSLLGLCRVWTLPLESRRSWCSPRLGSLPNRPRRLYKRSGIIWASRFIAALVAEMLMMTCSNWSMVSTLWAGPLAEFLTWSKGKHSKLNRLRCWYWTKQTRCLTTDSKIRFMTFTDTCHMGHSVWWYQQPFLKKYC